MSEHVSALQLDALALGALTGDEAARARGHLNACAACRADEVAAAALRERFDQVVFARTRPKLEQRSRGWWWLRFPALAAAVAVLVVLAFRAHRPNDERGNSEVGIKGEPAWHVVALRANQQFFVHDGTQLVAGDRVRFVVVPNRAPYLLVASIDGTGAVSIYFPFGGARSARIDGARIELPDSITLDAAPGPERVFAIFSERPIAADIVTEQLRALGARGVDAIRGTKRLDLRARAQLSIVFEKGAL